MFDALSRTVAIVGHYGSGKTNLSLNLALALKGQGRRVAIADLDVLNPYFGSGVFKALAEREGLRVITSAYAGSTLDIPALTGRLAACLGGEDTIVIDAGGDGDGSLALGSYAPMITQGEYDLLFVVNFFRALTKTARQAADYLREIETACRLKVTAIANNSNLGEHTTPQDISASIEEAAKLCQITQKPLLFTSMRDDIARQFVRPDNGIFPVKVYPKTPWE
ncbi:MAG: hypothetical protein FWE19_02640 [Oscillospiraceae bacterium]|nr:hypothetical protein [Oscillospiraceae bacterium]